VSLPFGCLVADWERKAEGRSGRPLDDIVKDVGVGIDREVWC
jgi:hypothetical protein